MMVISLLFLRKWVWQDGSLDDEGDFKFDFFPGRPGMGSGSWLLAVDSAHPANVQITRPPCHHSGVKNINES